MLFECETTGNLAETCIVFLLATIGWQHLHESGKLLRTRCWISYVFSCLRTLALWYDAWNYKFANFICSPGTWIFSMCLIWGLGSVYGLEVQY